MKKELPPPFGTLTKVLELINNTRNPEAAKVLKEIIAELTSERMARNEKMYKELYQFAHRVMSVRGKKTPEEVAILPAVVKILLKR